MWVRKQHRRQIAEQKAVIGSLWKSNRFLRLMQLWRNSVLQDGQIDQHQEAQINEVHRELFKLKKELDEDPVIAANDYWMGLRDHWQRFNYRDFKLSKAVRFKQLTSMIDNAMSLLIEEAQNAANSETFNEKTGLFACAWRGLPAISESIYLLINKTTLTRQNREASNPNAYAQLEHQLESLKRLIETWLQPLNQNSSEFDSGIVLRAISSCDRIVRVYRQELLSQKNRHIANQSLLAICNEALRNIHTLQDLQIQYLRDYFHVSIEDD